jgi:hypothetical protein
MRRLMSKVPASAPSTSVATSLAERPGTAEAVVAVVGKPAVPDEDILDVDLSAAAFAVAWEASPGNVTRPALGLTSNAAILSNVDLPEPLAPSKATHSPGPI